MPADSSLSPLLSPDALTDTVWRWGQRALWGVLLSGLAVTLYLAWSAPEWLFLVPALVVGGTVWVALFRHPAANLVVLLSGFAAMLTMEDGVQPIEVLYALYIYAYLAVWYGAKMLNRERFVWTRMDWAAALLIFLGIPGGFVLGVLFGAPSDVLRSDTIAFSMIALYFPVKEFCRTQKHGPEILFAIIVWLGVFAAVRDFLNFREIILAATVDWQVADARPGRNEMQLLIPSLGLLAALIYARRLPTGGLALAGFVLVLGALIMTKARGYWVDFAFGFAVLLVLLPAVRRQRLIAVSVLGTAALVFVALVFFGPLVDLILSGTIRRFSTLDTALTEDVSLVNRFSETAGVWARIKQNPLLGWGFGTTYRYIDLIDKHPITKAFQHNGYTSLWFKVGLWGFLLMLTTWISSTWQGLLVYWNRGIRREHRVIALAMSLCLIAIIPSVSTSNPFVVLNQMFSFTLLLAVAAGLYQRHLLAAPEATTPGAAAMPPTS